jgi:peptide/nickel transport system permease protein
MTAGTLEPRGIAVPAVDEVGERPWQRAIRVLAGRKMALFGLGVVLFFIAVAILAPLISPYDPLATSWSAVRKAPSLLHPFGTDEIGRDVLARVIWGARASLLAGLVSVSLRGCRSGLSRAISAASSTAR